MAEQPLNSSTKEIAEQTSKAIEHDLVKTMRLLEQTQELGFRGVTYQTKQDDEGKLTVSITFPSMSEMEAFKAEKEAQEKGGPASPAAQTQSQPASQPQTPVEEPLPEEPMQPTAKRNVEVRVAGFENRAKFSKKFLKSVGL